MKKLFFLLSILAGTLIFSGCATMFSKSEYAVEIQSEPSGVDFEIRDVYGDVFARGVTPQTVTIPTWCRREEKPTRRNDCLVVFSRHVPAKNGVPARNIRDEITILPTVDPWFVFGNVGNLYLLAIVDIVTGAHLQYPENFVCVIDDDVQNAKFPQAFSGGNAKSGDSQNAAVPEGFIDIVNESSPKKN